ncbi:MAG: GTPase Era [Clostridia bacterium]|nr:GTPase Era [Clostridia bacterium]
MKKTGFIAIVGRPNVGKSTLLNAILGEKVAIVSSKPQTTRNRITGIHTDGENQFVFLDTPGIHAPKNALGEYMVKTANSTMLDGDVIVFVVDAAREPGQLDLSIVESIRASHMPAVLVLNKTDTANAEEIGARLTEYSKLYDFAAYVPISARRGEGIGAVLEECAKFLHEEEWFYPDDIVTDQPGRQMAAEIIREKLLRTLNKEIPHGIAVVIEEFKDEDTLIRISANIFCEKESHKGIIVGKRGAELKMVGTYAREDLEKLFGTKVYLNLWVKVKANWRESEQIVSNFGYQQDEE